MSEPIFPNSEIPNSEIPNSDILDSDPTSTPKHGVPEQNLADKLNTVAPQIDAVAAGADEVAASTASAAPLADALNAPPGAHAVPDAGRPIEITEANLADIEITSDDAEERLEAAGLTTEDLHSEDRDFHVKEGEVLVDIDHVTMKFGGLTALDDVDFKIHRGEILGLIGPNGAGKTTCFNAMTGVYRPTSGRVMFDGEDMSTKKRNQITRLGIARTFQNIRLFSTMTALENVVVGTDARHRTSIPGAVFRSARHRREEREGYDRAMALLEFVGIADRAEHQARHLPYGYQRRLEIARALATDPKLLCLDEPAAGFNPAEKVELMGLIRDIRDQGYTVLLIEHDMRLVMGVTDRIVVLEFGRKIADGAPAEIRNNPAVIAAYLGADEDEESDDGAA